MPGIEPKPLASEPNVVSLIYSVDRLLPARNFPDTQFGWVYLEAKCNFPNPPSSGKQTYEQIVGVVAFLPLDYRGSVRTR